MPKASGLILRQARFVNLPQLLTFCWATGIPVIQLRVFPLPQKRMQAMTVKVNEKYAILLGYESEYYARMAYILAHEIGHILRGHLEHSDSLLDIDDSLRAGNLDAEEVDADRAAFILLTGRANPQALADLQSYSASQTRPGGGRQCGSRTNRAWDIGAVPRSCNR